SPLAVLRMLSRSSPRSFRTASVSEPPRSRSPTSSRWTAVTTNLVGDLLWRPGLAWRECALCVLQRLLDRLELGRREPAGRERVRIHPAGTNLAIDRLPLRCGDRAVVDELLDGVEERLLVDGRAWPVGLVWQWGCRRLGCRAVRHRGVVCLGARIRGQGDRAGDRADCDECDERARRRVADPRVPGVLIVQLASCGVAAVAVSCGQGQANAGS